jgi:hypothetical protein
LNYYTNKYGRISEHPIDGGNGMEYNGENDEHAFDKLDQNNLIFPDKLSQ